MLHPTGQRLVLPCINRISLAASPIRSEEAGSALSLDLLNALTVGAVQQRFSRIWPFLKLEFYKQIELNGIRITKRLEADHPLRGSGPSAIGADTTVAQLKAVLSGLTGYAVRVFRKAGSLWIETSLTDDWSLHRQNEEGQL